MSSAPRRSERTAAAGRIQAADERGGHEQGRASTTAARRPAGRWRPPSATRAAAAAVAAPCSHARVGLGASTSQWVQPIAGAVEARSGGGDTCRGCGDLRLPAVTVLTAALRPPCGVNRLPAPGLP